MKNVRPACITAKALGIVSSLLMIAQTGCSRHRQTLTLDDFLKEMTNVNTFCRTPIGRPGMLSTHDRSGGNADWINLAEAPMTDGLFTLAELKGPGCVKRIWTTNIPAEEWLFFFDGEKEPRIHAPESSLFGRQKPFLPPLSDTVSSGRHCYIPLPYSESLRIAVRLNKVSPGTLSFYQINYESFEAGTEVESLPALLSKDILPRLDEVGRVWTQMATVPEGPAVEGARKRHFSLPPGQSAVWLNETGPGVLTNWTFHIKPSVPTTATARARLLRELVLRFYWDGQVEPSVNVPLGDFFCNGLHRERFSSMPLAVLDDAMVCRFPMPFTKSARAELRNDGPTPVMLETTHSVQSHDPKAIGAINYFHACWNSSTSPGIPHRVLRAKGTGHYVGCYLISIGTDGSWNILESDEVVYIDGETSPMHGTGLEDYFNGAWYYNGLFYRSSHGLLEKAAMRTAQYRFHLTDPVAFNTGLTLIWEFGNDSRNTAHGYMSSVAYWYQPEPHPTGIRMPPVADRFPAADRLELSSIMSGLFELERIGHYEEAAERCDFFAERFGATEYAPVLRLRATAYREMTLGFESVRAEYERAVAEIPDSPTSQQAQTLLWYHEASSNAILAVHANMRTRLYVDGIPVGEGANPLALFAFPVVLAPGSHEIAAEVTPLCPSAGVSFHLRGHTTNLVSDGTWESSRKRPASWPRTEDPAVSWTNVPPVQTSLPEMPWWQFIPNAYVNMQSGPRMIKGVWEGWDRQPYVTTYMRKRFVIPEK